MPSMAVEPEDEAARRPIGPTLGEGLPPLEPRARRTRVSHLDVQEEPPADVRAAERRASRRVFRLYCFSCGRSTESAAAPLRPGRCPACGGTMLLELAAD